MALPANPLAPKRTRPRGAKILVIAGAVLLVLGFVGTKVGIDRVRVHVKTIRDTGPNLRNSVLADVKVPGNRRVELEPGSYDVFAISAYGTGFRRPTSTTTQPGQADDPGPTGPFSEVGLQEPEVTLTGPDGTVLLPGEPAVGSIFAGVSGEMYAIASYRVVEPGTYRLSAAGGNAAEVGIAPSVNDGAVGRVAASGLVALVSALAAGLGFVLCLIGLIWFLASGGAPPPPTYPPAPGWGAAPPPGGIWPTPGPPPPR